MSNCANAATNVMSVEEWERRFKARIIDRLKPFKPLGHKGPGWTEGQAIQAADAEFSSVALADIRDGYEDRPEESADECMSYWCNG